MSTIAIKELERAIKYKQRELESFKHKLQLLNEQKEQYEKDLIPTFESEIEELKSVIITLKELDDVPF